MPAVGTLTGLYSSKAEYKTDYKTHKNNIDWQQLRRILKTITIYNSDGHISDAAAIRSLIDYSAGKRRNPKQEWPSTWEGQRRTRRWRRLSKCLGIFLGLFWFAEVLCGSQEIIMGPKKSSDKKLSVPAHEVTSSSSATCSVPALWKIRGLQLKCPTYIYSLIVIGAWPKYL